MHVMAVFENAIRSLDAAGFTDVVLPFVLIFTIVYAVGDKIPFFTGADPLKKKFRTVMALVISLLVIIPHVVNPGRFDVVSIIIQSIPQVALLLVAAMMIMYTLASTDAGTSFGKDVSKVKYGVIAIVLLIFAENLFSYGSYGLISQFRYLHWFGGGDIQAIVLMVVLFAGIVMFITGGDKTSAAASLAAKKAQLATEEAELAARNAPPPSG